LGGKRIAREMTEWTVSEGELWRDYLACNRVRTNPDGSLNIGGTINAATHDLWRHYLAAHDAADRDLTIAYLELLLSRMMRLLPDQDLALAELLRGRGDRVVLNRATSTIAGPSSNIAAVADSAPAVEEAAPRPPTEVGAERVTATVIMASEALDAAETAKRPIGAGSTD
jgi:hypothetical protein